MNTYLVILNIQSGEYQKDTTSMVEASTSQAAGTKAIKNESQGELEWLDGGAYDLGWQFHYSVNTIHKVDKADIETLRKYLD